MENGINYFFWLIQSHELLYLAVVASCIAKIFILFQFSSHVVRKPTIHKSLIFLLGAIGCSFFGDFAWVIKLTRTFTDPFGSYGFVTFVIRIAWAFLVMQYQSLAFFVQSLTSRRFTLSLFDKICLSLSTLLSTYFFYIAFFHINFLSNEVERELAKKAGGYLEFHMMQIVEFYILFVLILPKMYTIAATLRSNRLPKIITKQLTIFTIFFIIPYFATEFILGSFFKTIDSYYGRPLVTLSTILLILTIYYCIRKVMNLRFSNISSHVQSPPQVSLIDDFKTVLEQLGNAHSLHELSHITQTFFKEAFNLSIRDTTFILREKNQDIATCSATQHTIESFLTTIDEKTAAYIHKNTLLSYDEISFDQFYQEEPSLGKIITFLNDINADVFVPIFIKNNIIGAISIARGAREHCFSKADYDAMLVFANYLSNMINLLQNKNLDTLIHREKQLQEELYQRHQQINQYKESINSFLQQSKQKPIGIVFYKNNQFTFGNKAAQELLNIDMNEQEGHPITIALKAVAHHVETFKSPHTQFTRNEAGHMIILSGVPHLKHNHVIITVVYPEISDIIEQKISRLHDPNDWDYVLYLESTKAGALINELVPGAGPIMLNFKVQLLKAALSKRALLLDIPENDVTPMLEHIHRISLRETLHMVELTHPISMQHVAAKLQTATPLLKTLQSNGTLFIKNVHFLDRTLQEHLAHFIQYGYYQLHTSEQRIYSATRIICSTHQDVAALLQNEQFSSKLITLLKPPLTMPSLSMMHPQELLSLIDGFADQAIKSYEFKNLFALSMQEKERLIQAKPASLSEMKLKVQQLLVKKSKENHIQPEHILDPAYHISDPQLAHAARLGRQALKDHKIMAFLWHKFKNQNKIAQFLGVNRSSVHRRFKALNFSFDGKETIA